jgi:hypothetical protein
MRLFKKIKRAHEHAPIDPFAVALLRDRKQPDQILRWACECGEMIDDKTREVVSKES